MIEHINVVAPDVWRIVCGDWKDTTVAIHNNAGYIACGLDPAKAKALVAAAEQPDGDLKRLLTWAELHIGDQYERICELEDELKQADTENQRRAHALNALRAALGELGEVIMKENFSWPSDAFSKDLSSWRNALAAYGYKPDGTVKKTKHKEKSA